MHCLSTIDAEDSELTLGHLNKPWFIAYTKEVHKAIKKGAETIREIKAAVESDNGHRYLFDALSDLIGDGLIRRTRDLLPTRYTAKKKPVEEKLTKQINVESAPSVPRPYGNYYEHIGRFKG